MCLIWCGLLAIRRAPVATESRWAFWAGCWMTKKGCRSARGSFAAATDTAVERSYHPRARPGAPARRITQKSSHKSLDFRTVMSGYAPSTLAPCTFIGPQSPSQSSTSCDMPRRGVAAAEIVEGAGYSALTVPERISCRRINQAVHDVPVGEHGLRPDEKAGSYLVLVDENGAHSAHGDKGGRRPYRRPSPCSSCLASIPGDARSARLRPGGTGRASPSQ